MPKKIFPAWHVSEKTNFASTGRPRRADSMASPTCPSQDGHWKCKRIETNLKNNKSFHTTVLIQSNIVVRLLYPHTRQWSYRQSTKFPWFPKKSNISYIKSPPPSNKGPSIPSTTVLRIGIRNSCYPSRSYQGRSKNKSLRAFNGGNKRRWKIC